MYTLKNTVVTSDWFVNLKEHSEVEGMLPLNSINIRNDSSQIAYLNLWGRKVGEIQRYSSDTFGGRNFEEFRIYNPDGQEFAVDDLFVQMSKGQIMTSQPFNPQWDMLEDDLDRYVTGCDGRIAYSSSVAADMLKYWLNVHNHLIVQRKLDILGGASVGSYEIDMGGEKITGSTAIAFPIVDTKRYRKTIVNSNFDYSLTNCEIKGWMFDLRVDPNDVMTGATLVTGVDGEKAYDDDMATSTVEYSDSGIATGVHWEASFDEVSVASCHYAMVLKSNGFATHQTRTHLQLCVDSVWTTIASVDVITGGSPWLRTKTFREHDTVGWEKVTGVRVAYEMGGTQSYSKAVITDMSLIREVG